MDSLGLICPLPFIAGDFCVPGLVYYAIYILLPSNHLPESLPHPGRHLNLCS
jgi:hypothetical protein